MLINPRLLPTVMIVISILAGVVYALNGDVKKSGYWISAAALNYFVTY